MIKMILAAAIGAFLAINLNALAYPILPWLH
jgi:hypothetical protein